MRHLYTVGCEGYEGYVAGYGRVRWGTAMGLLQFDDTYVADAPRAALETMLEGDDLAQLWSGVESNKSKRCMWAPDPRSLDAVRDRTDVKGTPDSADGVLRGIRVLGAYLGDKAWCRDKLVKRVRKALEPLNLVCGAPADYLESTAFGAMMSVPHRIFFVVERIKESFCSGRQLHHSPLLQSAVYIQVLLLSV